MASAALAAEASAAEAQGEAGRSCELRMRIAISDLGFFDFQIVLD